MIVVNWTHGSAWWIFAGDYILTTLTLPECGPHQWSRPTLGSHANKIKPAADHLRA